MVCAPAPAAEANSPSAASAAVAVSLRETMRSIGAKHSARGAGRHAKTSAGADSALPGVDDRREYRATPHVLPLDAVVHVELDRMGGHAQARDFLHLQSDIGIDHIVGEPPATLEELPIVIQV